VVHQQLAPAVEQVQQAHRALGPVEDVLLTDLDHRQPAPLCVQLVASPGQLLLVGEQLLACHQPLVMRDDPRVSHLELLS
jgi:hypothetical protein